MLPVTDTGYVVLWRKSLLDPGWQPVPAGMPPAWVGRDPGYGITLVDFAAELFGLSTLWLGAGFFVNNTAHGVATSTGGGLKLGHYGDVRNATLCSMPRGVGSSRGLSKSSGT